MSAETPLDIHLKYMNEKFEHLERRFDGLATSGEVAAVAAEIAAVKAEVDKIIPWMNTLSTLEKVAKWAVVIAAGVGAVVATIKGLGK